MTAEQWPQPQRSDQPLNHRAPVEHHRQRYGLGQPPPPEPARHVQPLLLAKTLLIIFLARILLLVARELGLEVVRWGLDAMDVSSSLLHALIGFGASVLAQLSSGLWVACLVLAIVAIVRSRDQLRTGAIMLLIALVVSSIFGFEVSGDFGSGRVSAALSVLERAFDLAAVIVSALGAFFLLRGCRSAARDAGPRYAVI